MTLNEVLHKLYSINNELENGNIEAADEGLFELTRQFEAQIDYKPDSYGDLRDECDKQILFQK